MLNPEITIQQKLHKCLKRFYLSLKIIFFRAHNLHATSELYTQTLLQRHCKSVYEVKTCKTPNLNKRLVAKQAAQAIDLCVLLQPQANIFLGCPWLWGQEQRSPHSPGSSPGLGRSHSCRPIC